MHAWVAGAGIRGRGAVELFPEDVGMPGVPGGLAGHVGDDPPQRMPVAVGRDPAFIRLVRTAWSFDEGEGVAEVGW